MKKVSNLQRLCICCLLGAPIGLALSSLITIAISCSVGDGVYYAVVPELVTDCGTELNAVLIQTVCSLLYGAAWGGASVIWKMEKWSLTRMTLTHLAVCSVATFPVASLMRWMRHSFAGILSYFAVFFGIYLVIWLSQYLTIKRQISHINKNLPEGGQ